MRGLFLDEDDEFAAQGSQPRPKDSYNMNLDYKRALEMQAQERIKEKIHELYHERIELEEVSDISDSEEREMAEERN